MLILSTQITIIVASVAVFLSVIVLLVGILLFAKKKLIPSGELQISINDGEHEIMAEPGNTLLTTLSNNKIFLPSACGGGGTCAIDRKSVV